MKLKELHAALQGLEVFERPKVALEQYPTGAHLASRVLYTIETAYGDLSGRVVVDLGCGTAMLSIGAALMGAASVTGVDVDAAALAVARRNAARFGGGDDDDDDDENEGLPIDFVRADVSAMSGEPGGGDWGAPAVEDDDDDEEGEEGGGGGEERTTATASGSSSGDDDEHEEEEEDDDEEEGTEGSSSESSSADGGRPPRLAKQEREAAGVRRRHHRGGGGGDVAPLSAAAAAANRPAPLLLGRRGPMVDTVVMNPPFGTRLRGADVRFLRAAVRILRAPWEKQGGGGDGDEKQEDEDEDDDDDASPPPPGAVYSLHKASTRAHLLRLALSPPQAGGLGCASAEVVAELRYDLPCSYAFHRRRSVDVAVDLIRLEVPRGPRWAAEHARAAAARALGATAAAARGQEGEEGELGSRRGGARGRGGGRGGGGGGGRGGGGGGARGGGRARGGGGRGGRR